MLAIVRQAAAAEQKAARKLLNSTVLPNELAKIHGDALSRLSSTNDASPLASARECGAGCAMCCLTVSVDATGLEAIAIADHMRRTMDAERIAIFERKLRLSTERRIKISQEQRKQVRMACAFLDGDGLCSIYESRPLACAGVFSMSRESCEDAYDADELAAQQIPLDQPAKLATMGTSAGLQRALVDVGLDGNLYELHSATYVALTTPNAAQRFFAKEDVFAYAICTDAHSPPRVAQADETRRIDSSHQAGELKKRKRRSRQRVGR